MEVLRVLGCGICKEVYSAGGGGGGGLVAPISCGHIFHKDCVHKWEQEQDVVLKLCFLCKSDYAKSGLVSIAPVYEPVDLDQFKPATGHNEGPGGGDSRAEQLKALKNDNKNLKAQMKKDGKMMVEMKKNTELREMLAQSKIRRLIAGISDLHLSVGKFCDAKDLGIVVVPGFEIPEQKAREAEPAAAAATAAAPVNQTMQKEDKRKKKTATPSKA